MVVVQQSPPHWFDETGPVALVDLDAGLVEGDAVAAAAPVASGLMDEYASQSNENLNLSQSLMELRIIF